MSDSVTECYKVFDKKDRIVDEYVEIDVSVGGTFMCHVPLCRGGGHSITPDEYGSGECIGCGAKYRRIDCKDRAGAE